MRQRKKTSWYIGYIGCIYAGKTFFEKRFSFFIVQEMTLICSDKTPFPTDHQKHSRTTRGRDTPRIIPCFFTSRSSFICRRAAVGLVPSSREHLCDRRILVGEERCVSLISRFDSSFHCVTIEEVCLSEALQRAAVPAFSYNAARSSAAVW